MVSKFNFFESNCSAKTSIYQGKNLVFRSSWSPTEMQQKFCSVFGRNKDTPSVGTLRRWQEEFQQCGSFGTSERSRAISLESDQIFQCFQEAPRRSIRILAYHCQVSYSSVRRCLKLAKYRTYKHQVVQAMFPQDLNVLVNFSTKNPYKISDDPQFMKLLMFSVESIFHPDGGVSKQIMRHWSENNLEWKIERSLNSPKLCSGQQWGTEL